MIFRLVLFLILISNKRKKAYLRLFIVERLRFASDRINSGVLAGLNSDGKERLRIGQAQVQNPGSILHERAQNRQHATGAREHTGLSARSARSVSHTPIAA